MICAGCSSLPPVVNRTLPPETTVVLDPVPTPPLASLAGKDARVELDRTRNINDENVARLKASRKIYRGVRKKFAGQK